MKIIKIFWLLLLECVICHANAQNEIGVRDSVRDLNMSGGPKRSSPYRYTYGRRIYPLAMDSVIIRKIIKDDNIYYCMVVDGDSDELTVFANLQIEDFSLGGPYTNMTDSAIFAKFKHSPKGTKLFPDTVPVCNDDDCDCPPYEFIISVDRDILSYRRSEHSGPYDFFRSKLYTPQYTFGDYRVGKEIRKCKLGKLIPYNLINQFSIIRLCDYKNYFFYEIEKDPEYSIEVTLYLEKSIIKKIELYFEP